MMGSGRALSLFAASPTVRIPSAGVCRGCGGSSVMLFNRGYSSIGHLRYAFDSACCCRRPWSYCGCLAKTTHHEMDMPAEKLRRFLTFREVRRQIEDAHRRFGDCSGGSENEVNEDGKAESRSVQTHPTKPFPTPLKKPKAPSLSAPSRGFI